MQPGKKIRELRKKKDLKQWELAKIIGLTQGYISDIERGKQSPSPRFISKISGPLEISKEDLSSLLGATTAKGLEDIWPPIVKENRQVEFGTWNLDKDRRVPENDHKKKLINNVLKILDSENKKVIKALKSNIELSLIVIKKKEIEIEESD